MSELERRALYTLLRINWQEEDEVEPWQVEEYRKWPLERLLSSLQHLGLQLDQSRFHHFSNECDTPEELLDLLGDEELSPQEEDRIYLLLFELWRRLQPEKPSLSIFGEELDHWIEIYNRGEIANPEKVQDLLGNLQELLDENVDEGGEPIDVFASFSRYCAADLESFLYDYIADQLDAGDWDYSSELLDGFHDYVSDSLWFDLLYVRLWSHVDEEAVEEALEELVTAAQEEPDLELYLELLDLLARLGRVELFSQIARRAVEVSEDEADLDDLTDLCIELCDEADLDATEFEEAKGRGALLSALKFRQLALE